MAAYQRTLPLLSEDNREFWTSGEQGELRFTHCLDCGYFLHPRGYVCPRCLGTALGSVAVSGRGAVEGYTINRQPWAPGMPDAFIYACVLLDEQDDLRVMTNIVNCAADEVRCGLRVRVRFEQDEDVWLPMFEPAGPDPREDAA